MKALYDLRDLLCEELEEYGKKGELSAGTLDIVDKLTHTIKNLDKIIEVNEDEEYSNASGPHGDGYGGMIDHDGVSYGRGRDGRRDSRGRYSGRGYSRKGDMADRLRDLMHDAPDEKTRQDIQRIVTRIDQM